MRMSKAKYRQHLYSPDASYAKLMCKQCSEPVKLTQGEYNLSPSILGGPSFFPGSSPGCSLVFLLETATSPLCCATVLALRLRFPHLLDLLLDSQVKAALQFGTISKREQDLEPDEERS
jgi:hypothetical protein